LSGGVCLLHGNAQAHSTHVTTALLEKFKWGILNHSQYNLDLESRISSFFLRQKEHLPGKKFDDKDEVQDKVMMWFKMLARNFYASGIEQLVPRLNKNLDNGGEYVEK